MTFKTDDRVYETSTTTGTGAYALAGAVTGFQAFSVMTAGNDCPYFATDDTNWEVGIGTIGSGPATLARTTILASSNAGSAVNWGSGTRKIRCGLPAAMAGFRALSKSVAGSSNVTLTQDEQRRDVLVFTGVLTGSINVIVDATLAEWTVYNNTTGAYTLTVKTSGGTGKAVTQGKSTRLRCDGTNVVDAIDMLTSLSVAGALTVGGAVTIAAAQEVTLAGSSGTNFGRLSYSSSGNTALLLDNGFDSASAEIRLRLRTLGSTVNGLVLTPTTALVPGSLSAASVTGAMVAAASDQETGTSATVVVTPSVQQRHASATKAWIKCNEAGGIHASYNVTSITDTGTGALTVTWDTDFSSVHYKTNGTAESGSQYFVTVGTPAAGSCTYNCWRSDTAALVDPTAYHIDANGDQ